MKALARSYVWWPGTDTSIEEEVRTCVQCQSNLHDPAEAPLHPSEWPAKPWSRLHIDHAGPFLGAHYLVLIDSHSKWMEVEKVSSTATEPTIRVCNVSLLHTDYQIPLCRIMVQHSLVKSLVCFVKPMEYVIFRSTPRHPSMNGLAERAVQVFKACVKKMDEKLPIELRITRFLARYRITPQTTTGRTPAELLMSRLPKTHLDLLRGNLESRVHRKQDNQKKYDNASQLRVFENGDLMFTHSAPVGSRKITWIPGVVRRVTDPLSYELEIEGQGIVKHHVDQIRKRYCEVPSNVSVGSDFLMDFLLTTPFNRPMLLHHLGMLLYQMVRPQLMHLQYHQVLLQ